MSFPDEIATLHGTKSTAISKALTDLPLPVGRRPVCTIDSVSIDVRFFFFSGKITADVTVRLPAILPDIDPTPQTVVRGMPKRFFQTGNRK